MFAINFKYIEFLLKEDEKYFSKLMFSVPCSRNFLHPCQNQYSDETFWKIDPEDSEHVLRFVRGRWEMFRRA